MAAGNSTGPTTAAWWPASGPGEGRTPTEPVLGDPAGNDPDRMPPDLTRPALPGYVDVVPLAVGGLGEVYTARDESLNRVVAVKLIRPSVAASPTSQARFRREAEITAGLDHAGVVPVYCRGEAADGRPFYAMKFVRGVPLSVLIARFHGNVGAGSRRYATELFGLVELFARLCQTVGFAHRHGVIHRDLKPDNVVVTAGREVYVVDWGLAGRVAEWDGLFDQPGAVPPSLDPLTVEGQVLGSPRYMSPEQARGAARPATATDVFCLGATLYHLLTGGPPYAGRQLLEVVGRAVGRDCRPPGTVDRRVPAPLAAVCWKAMATAAGDRYPSADELADDIGSWMSGAAVTAWSPPLLVRLLRWVNRSLVEVNTVAGMAKLLVLLPVTFVLAAVLVAALWLVSAALYELRFG